MSEFRSVGRSSPCQSVLVSFLMIIVSSSLINTSAAAAGQDGQVGCRPKYALIRPLIKTVKTALEKGVPMATEWIRKELNRPFEDAMESIHVCAYKSEYRVIEGISKTIGFPSPQNFFDNINEKETISNLLLNLYKVHRALQQRQQESRDRGILSEANMFTNLNEENELVKHDYLNVLAIFDVKYPELPQTKSIRPAADRTEHVRRNWIILHDYILLMEYINEFSRHLMKKYCGVTTD